MCHREAAVKPIVAKKQNRPRAELPLDEDGRDFTCECGRQQPAPDDEAEAEQFARLCGWRKNADGSYSCPFCAGGDNLKALKDIFEGRGKERFS